MSKQFMLVSLSKEDHDTVALNEGKIYAEYDQALDALNTYIAEWNVEPIPRPRYEQPLQVSLEYENMELWIINRKAEL